MEENADAPEAKKAKIEDGAEVTVHEPVDAVLLAVAPISPMDEGLSNHPHSCEALFMTSS